MSASTIFLGFFTVISLGSSFAIVGSKFYYWVTYSFSLMVSYFYSSFFTSGTTSFGNSTPHSLAA